MVWGFCPCVEVCFAGAGQEVVDGRFVDLLLLTVALEARLVRLLLLNGAVIGGCFLKFHGRAFQITLSLHIDNGPAIYTFFDEYLVCDGASLSSRRLYPCVGLQELYTLIDVLHA